MQLRENHECEAREKCKAFDEERHTCISFRRYPLYLRLHSAHYGHVSYSNSTAIFQEFIVSQRDALNF